MAELGIPGTYLMQNEIALGKDSNETNIKGLNALYAKHLNELISCTIEYNLPMMVGKTATDLIKRLGGGAEEKALGMDMMENLMLLIQRMCRFATEVRAGQWRQRGQRRIRANTTHHPPNLPRTTRD